MRILFSVHLYPPTHNCGGEYYIHNLAKWLISQGHQCRVLLKQAATYGITSMYEHEGVEVFPAMRGEEDHFFWCDVAISHLEYGPWTLEMCRIYKKPFFFIAHNDSEDEYDSIYNSHSPVNIVFNSWWIYDKVKTVHSKTVLHPPVDWRKYDTRGYPGLNNFITLINCNRNKGGHIFSQIVREMPKKMFLAVLGSYEKQILPDDEDRFLLKIQANTPNIIPIYKQTRILLMPSKYESWGMTATEAMCNGIPVICTDTPGLRENCQDAAIYVVRDDIQGWIDAIKKLDNLKVYEKYSKLGRKRSRELDPWKEYKALEDFIYAARI